MALTQIRPVIIENRTGAAGNIGAEMVYRSDPDGYTLLSSPPPPLVINQNSYPKLGFDPAKFEPVVVMAQVPNALIVNPKKLKASSVSELIDYLAKDPGHGHGCHTGQWDDPASCGCTLPGDGQGATAFHIVSRIGTSASGLARRRR